MLKFYGGDVVSALSSLFTIPDLDSIRIAISAYLSCLTSTYCTTDKHWESFVHSFAAQHQFNTSEEWYQALSEEYFTAKMVHNSFLSLID